MFEIELIPALIILMIGITLGVVATLIINKVRTGSASASKLKREMEDYQNQVEAHFEETSIKFKNMAAQYQDMYKHMAVGATTLCRSDSAVSSLGDPLANAPVIEPPKKRAKNNGVTAGTNKSARPDKQTSKSDIKRKSDVKRPASEAGGGSSHVKGQPSGPTRSTDSSLKRNKGPERNNSPEQNKGHQRNNRPGPKNKRNESPQHGKKADQNNKL